MDEVVHAGGAQGVHAFGRAGHDDEGGEVRLAELVAQRGGERRVLVVGAAEDDDVRPLPPHGLDAGLDVWADVVAAARKARVPIIFTRYVYRADFRDGGVLVEELMPALALANRRAICG